jgi:hypothetical protein
MNPLVYGVLALCASFLSSSQPSEVIFTETVLSSRIIKPQSGALAALFLEMIPGPESITGVRRIS